MVTYSRLNFLQNAVRQFPDNPEIRRAFMKERQAVLEQVAAEENERAQESELKSLGRLLVGTAATAAPWLASRAIKSALPGGQVATAYDILKVASPFLLDAATGASSMVNQYVRGQEVTGQTPAGAVEGLGVGLLQSVPHPVAQLIGAGMVGSGLATRYGEAQQELGNIGADTGVLNTALQMTAGLPMPGVTTGGNPTAVAMDLYSLAGTPRTVAEHPATTRAVRKLFASPDKGFVRGTVLPAVLRSSIGKAIFGERAGKLDVAPATYEFQTEKKGVIPGIKRGAPVGAAVAEPIVQESGARAPAVLTERGTIKIDRAYAKELHERGFPVEITDPVTGAKNTIDPRRYSLGQWIKRTLGHEVGHLGGAEGEIGAEMVAEDVASGLRSIFSKKVHTPMTPIEEVGALESIRQNIAARPKAPAPRDRAFGRGLAKIIAIERANVPEDSDIYNRGMSIYQHMKAGEGGGSEFGKLPKALRERIAADYDKARKSGKGPFFMAINEDEATGRKPTPAPGGSWLRSIQEGIESITDSTFRVVLTNLKNIRESIGDIAVETAVSKNKRGMPMPGKIKKLSAIEHELEQAVGEAKINHAEIAKIASETGYDKLRSVIANDALPQDHPFRTSAPDIIKSLNEAGAEATAKAFGLTPVEVQAAVAARDFMSSVKEFSDKRGYMKGAPMVKNYVKQTPKELEKLIGEALPTDDTSRSIILAESLEPGSSKVQGGDIRKLRAISQKIQDVRGDMIQEIYEAYLGQGVAPDKAMAAANRYTAEYLKSQIYRDIPLRERLKRVKSGYMEARSVPGLGKFQETDFARLLPIVEAEYAKFAEFPKAKWAMDNVVRVSKNSKFLDKNIRAKVMREMLDYYSSASSKTYESQGSLAEVANRWFGTNFRNAAEAHQAVIGFLTKNLIATPKFLLTMNPFDPVFRAAQNAVDMREVDIMRQIIQKYVFERSESLRKIAKPLIREGNLMRQETQWKAGDRGILPEFIQNTLGKTAYEWIGKIYNAIPNAVERQEISNNRMIFLWNLERNLRGKGPVPKEGFGGQLAIERIEKLPRKLVEVATKKAMSQTYEQQGRIGGLFGKSGIAAEIGRGEREGRNSAANIAFLYGRMFMNYPITTVNNVLRTIRQINESGDASKIRMIQPIALIAVAGVTTYGLPQYVADVAAGKEDTFVRNLVEGITREFRIPTTTLPGRVLEDVGRGTRELMKGNLSGAAANYENLLGASLPGYSVGKQIYGLAKLFGRKQ